MLHLTPAILNDLARRVLGRTPHYVPIVGAAGAPAAVTAPGALEGWNSTVSRGGYFDNRVGASDVAEIAMATAMRTAADHFDVYHPPLLAQLLADQTIFLRKHLNVHPA